MESTDRRDALAALATVAAVGATALLSRPAMAAAPQSDDACLPDNAGPTADRFPNVPVWLTGRGRQLFYTDCVQGRVVLTHFTSVRDEGAYPVLDNVARVADLLGERLGTAVALYSVTAEPDRDSSDVLDELARSYGARPGWHFVGGPVASILAIHQRMFHSQLPTGPECSRGLMRYGNEPAGLWGSVPLRTEPSQVVQRLDWVRTRPVPTGPPTRRGPPIRSV